MNILEKIVAHKYTEVAACKAAISVQALEKRPLFKRQPYSLREFIHQQDKTGVIAEFKRKSPSKGDINVSASLEQVVAGYEKSRASAVSVLTDGTYFGGTVNDVESARAQIEIPILRKEFVIDAYQVIEAKAIGADAILLIAAVLSPIDIVRLGSLAQQLGMEVLLEVHNEHELHASLTDKVNLIGVNNRDLKTFHTDVTTSYALAEHIPDSFTKVSESGISNPDVIKALRRHGYSGFLIGETFMSTTSPEQAAEQFMAQL